MPDVVFDSWLLILNTAPNNCLHHSRLGSCEIDTMPIIPRIGEYHDPDFQLREPSATGLTAGSKAAVPGVNRNHLHEEPPVLPPTAIRQQFAHVVEPLWKQHTSNERQFRTLATLRDTLLPKLLSGEALPTT